MSPRRTWLAERVSRVTLLHNYRRTGKPDKTCMQDALRQYAGVAQAALLSRDHGQDSVTAWSGLTLLDTTSSCVE
jgi:cell division protein FtsX